MATPRGILIPVGGGEDKEGRKSVLERIISETRRSNPLIEVITVATNLPEEVAEDYRAAFEDLRVTDVGNIHIKDRDEASDGKFIDRLKTCDCVFFTGGNQLKLSSLLGGSEIMKLIHERYMEDKDFVVAGTSAGAAAMSYTMIVAGSSQDALIKGELHLNNGFGLINNVFIDTHFTQRGRFGRLIHTVTSNPAVLGLGLGEDTGAVIYDGREMEIIGSGLVVVADGLHIKYTDLPDVRSGDPIAIEGITLHVLTRGKRFDLEERKVLW